MQNIDLEAIQNDIFIQIPTDLLEGLKNLHLLLVLHNQNIMKMLLICINSNE